ncbi:sulfate/molybdate ABC transporter ATP-binding protein [Plastoroseomonas arctica]|uniref:ATP-binding cassette domain-containing protein n=1 Tax=Plastoroseomonas arctica TaxID=1509237 RepID=A0AAF1KKT6_9PROT|nr:ATP-binding cassette domain-containing protein [Plastoroseomonas arctica]MBR0653906.1 ATP-binding cassette domain-containing protein [Plastoroseomonas arctica]
MSVEIEAVTRDFGTAANPALRGVSMALRSGEFVALLGPSGSGKTTLLRILAGLDFPDAGRVLIGGRDVAQVPARDRNVGVVFQNYALFRHMTVFENVAFGLRVRPRAQRPANAEIDRRVRELLALVQIPELAPRYPEQISGGQRQRVALARALAIEPQLLLLDEPFGALDALVRKDVRRWVRGLHDRLGLTSLLVTHDQEEAMEMADRVAVMEQGRIVQFDPPHTLIDAPASAFVARFVGDANRLAASVHGGRLDIAGFGGFDAAGLPEGAAEIFVRPDDLRILPPRDGLAPGLVEWSRPAERGRWKMLVAVGEHRLEGYGERAFERGAACALEFQALTAFGARGERVSINGREAAPSLR